MFKGLRTVAIGMDFPTYPVGVSKASFVFLNILPWVSLNLDHLALSSFASSVSIGGPVSCLAGLIEFFVINSM